MDLTHRSPVPKIRFNIITTKEIEKVISSLHPKNSYGYDEISMKILKISAPYTWGVQVLRYPNFFLGMEADRNVKVVGGDVAVL